MTPPLRLRVSSLLSTASRALSVADLAKRTEASPRRISELAERHPSLFVLTTRNGARHLSLRCY